MIPVFQRDWALSNTGAGWVSGIYCARYLAAAIGPPVLRRRPIGTPPRALLTRAGLPASLWDFCDQIKPMIVQGRHPALASNYA